MSLKNSNDTIGNRTSDLPACSAVPQPTAPPRAPFKLCTVIYFIRRPYTFHSLQLHSTHAWWNALFAASHSLSQASFKHRPKPQSSLGVHRTCLCFQTTSYSLYETNKWKSEQLFLFQKQLFRAQTLSPLSVAASRPPAPTPPLPSAPISSNNTSTLC